jgi:hypothetical protein
VIGGVARYQDANIGKLLLVLMAAWFVWVGCVCGSATQVNRPSLAILSIGFLENFSRTIVQVLLSHCFAKQCTKLELVTLVPLIHLRALFSPSFGQLKEEEEEEEKEKGQ